MINPTTCNHLYMYTGYEECPDCRFPTHDPDYSEIALAHKVWVNEHPDHIPSGWTSI